MYKPTHCQRFSLSFARTQWRDAPGGAEGVKAVVRNYRGRTRRYPTTSLLLNRVYTYFLFIRTFLPLPRKSTVTVKSICFGLLQMADQTMTRIL